MIKLTDIHGRALLLSPGQIAMMQQAGPSQRWHGVAANVQMAVDGKWIEVRESVADIEQQLGAQ